VNSGACAEKPGTANGFYPIKTSPSTAGLKLFLPRSGSKCPTLPLYRQEKIFGRVGLPIARSTQAQWVGAGSG
jgi:transposase